jgi:predicted ATP-dependent serine protease
MAAYAICCNNCAGHGNHTVGRCSECGATVYNHMHPSALWMCDHGPYGEQRRQLTDRELLEDIHTKLARVERHLDIEIQESDSRTDPSLSTH